MTRRRYKQGVAREQTQFLPRSVDEYVAEDNPVRAIDAYVGTLDLAALGFKNTAVGVSRGQPAYPPAALLKLYLYGYLNRVRSSRRLAAECERNLEVIWLVEGLRPKYKAIADFRKDNLRALKAVNRDFVQVCKQLGLFGTELVSLDGSFFRGNVGKKNIYTEERLKKTLERIDQHIAEYLAELEHSDEQETDEPQRSVADLQEKLKQLKERKQAHQGRMEKLKASGEKQLAEVDEDARLLSKRGQSVAGYNVQVAVDSQNKLMLSGDVVQDGNDEGQLAPMAQAAKAELGVEKLEVVADAGYFNAQGIQSCQEAGITPFVPEPDKTNQASLEGRFSREDFTYEPQSDVYRCPNGKILTRSSKQQKQGKTIFMYRSSASACKGCPLRKQCLPKKTPYRNVTRWEHEEVLEAHRQRMAERGRSMMHRRACLSEHPFGTLKVWLGWTHFLLRGLEKVRTEFNLLMLSYNFKRVLRIVGLAEFRAFCLQRVEKPGLGC